MGNRNDSNRNDIFTLKQMQVPESHRIGQLIHVFIDYVEWGFIANNDELVQYIKKGWKMSNRNDGE